MNSEMSKATSHWKGRDWPFIRETINSTQICENYHIYDRFQSALIGICPNYKITPVLAGLAFVSRRCALILVSTLHHCALLLLLFEETLCCRSLHPTAHTSLQPRSQLECLTYSSSLQILSTFDSFWKLTKRGWGSWDNIYIITAASKGLQNAENSWQQQQLPKQRWRLRSN